MNLAPKRKKTLAIIPDRRRRFGLRIARVEIVERWDGIACAMVNETIREPQTVRFSGRDVTVIVPRGQTHVMPFERLGNARQMRAKIHGFIDRSLSPAPAEKSAVVTLLAGAGAGK